MIIEIESIYGDSLLHGRAMTLSEINKLMKEVLNIVDEQEFIIVFCDRTGHEMLSYQADISVDYVVDLDTHTVYKPRY